MARRKSHRVGRCQIVPLITDRGVAQPVDAALDRLRRTVIEASKQCGRNRLLEIAEPAGCRASSLHAAPAAALRLIADPSGQPLAEVGRTGQAIVAAIGPEGGFTPEEQGAARAAGWQPYRSARQSSASKPPRSLWLPGRRLVLDPLGFASRDAGCES